MTCEAFLHDDVLTVRNTRIERTWRWNGGNLIGLSLVDRSSGDRWLLEEGEPDCRLPGVEDAASHGTLTLREVPGHGACMPHLEAIVEARLGTIEMRRVFRVYPDCPAIVGDIYLRGTANGTWLKDPGQPGERANVERLAGAFLNEIPAPSTERLRCRRRHLHLTFVRFFDITDQRNTLVDETRAYPYRPLTAYPGNLMLARDVVDGRSFWMLKQAPCSDVQLAWPGGDFAVDQTGVQVIGLGLEPGDLVPDEWRRGYGVVVGVGGLDELRAYQHAVRTDMPDRDHVVMANTWGDRSQDSRMNERFVLAELEACKRYGISHLQLDDGWQKGRSSNSAFEGGSLQNIWRSDDYWQVHPERFPRGLAPVLARARELGIEICLWFNPSSDDDYANWERDAETLIGLWREHGIRIFKIDGVVMRTARADHNLRAMFDRVMAATEGETAFNLDVTAGRRWGYHLGREYGTIFVENRYTDWSNYYPHTTLRNLWQLSRYVPAQSLQIEFLNIWRNADRYPADDPLAPARVPFAYAFALTMMAQPLAWMELQNLPPEAATVADLIRRYREHQPAIHAGSIFPIGGEPSGTGWTGFQSCRGDEGYLLFLREWNQRPSANIRLWEAPSSRLACRDVMTGQEFELDVDDQRQVRVTLAEPFSFVLLAYRAV